MLNDIKTAVTQNRAVQVGGIITVLVATIIGGITLQPGQQAFLETFDGTPTSPTPFIDNTNGWHVSADIDTRQTGTYAQQGHHGPACQAPIAASEPSAGAYTTTNSHPLVANRDAVFICNDHLMTATGLAGFGDLLLSPPAMLDFSGGPARLEWDMSTFRTGARDWVNFTLMPESQYVRGVVMTQEGGHNPNDAIHIFQGGVLGGTAVLLACQRVGGVNTFGSLGGCFPDRYVGGDSSTTWETVQSANGVAPSAQRRDHFVVELSATHIKVCITGNNAGQTYTYRGLSGFCWTDRDLPTPLGSVWQGHASLVIDHASYNVEKSCTGGAVDQFNIVHSAEGDANCPPNTWHFDNIAIAPAIMRGGAPSPTQTPSLSPSSTPTPGTSTSSPVPTSTATPTASIAPTASPSPTATATVCEAMVRLNGQVGWAPQPPSFCAGFHP